MKYNALPPTGKSTFRFFFHSEQLNFGKRLVYFTFYPALNINYITLTGGTNSDINQSNRRHSLARKTSFEMHMSNRRHILQGA